MLSAFSPGEKVPRAVGWPRREFDASISNVRPQGRSAAGATSSRTRRCRGRGLTPRRYWPASPGWSRASCRAIANCWRSATRCRRRSMSGIAGTARWRAIRWAIRPSSGRSATWCRSRADFQIETSGLDPEISTHLRAATRRAGVERALCAQCRQCALGVALRCALRHRRDPARRRAGAGQGLQCGAGSGGDRLWREVSGRDVPADQGQPRRRDRLHRAFRGVDDRHRR